MWIGRHYLQRKPTNITWPRLKPENPCSVLEPPCPLGGGRLQQDLGISDVMVSQKSPPWARMGYGVEAALGYGILKPGHGVPMCSLPSVRMQQIVCPRQQGASPSCWGPYWGYSVDPETWAALGHSHCVWTAKPPTFQTHPAEQEAFREMFLCLFSHEHSCCSSSLSHFC